MIEQNAFANGDLFAHELGHHWWGDLVAPTIHNHMWLKEGPAEYSSHLFVEWKDGHQAFVDLVKDNQQFVLEECHVQDLGFHPLSPMPDSEIYGRHTYYKGASVMHNLRAYLGDEVFRNAVQNVIAERFDSHMDVTDFEVLLEDATGEDLTLFFEAQALQPGFSTWVLDSLSTVPQNDGFGTTLHLQQKLRACFNHHENEPLDVTLWDANWDTTLVHARVGGQYDQITFWHEDPVVLVGLNADGRLNQGRLDHTFAITEPTGLSTLPWVEMRMGCDELPSGDSILVRVEHHWASPDEGPAAFYFDALSDTHFWTVDGTWDDSASDAPILDGRLTYVGADSTDLDFDLFGSSEEGAFLAWRARAGDPWQQYPDYDWQAGSMTNGAGVFRLSRVRKGQYAFAKGNVALAVEEATKPQAPDLQVMPNPVSDILTWAWSGAAEVVSIRVSNPLGQQVLEAGGSRKELNLENLPAGRYQLQLLNGKGQPMTDAAFVVIR
jgi:aminopeptidase N